MISIHALREEGDLPSLRRFLWFSISIHALREEGDSFASVKSPVFSSFLSTPSARRATVSHNDPDYLLRISIHALREEGDYYVQQREDTHNDFYPRPPRGGRLGFHVGFKRPTGFLSTPSARRATDPNAPPG